MDAEPEADFVRGTPQGAPISPLLANVYLHNVLATVSGEASIVRYADDLRRRPAAAHAQKRPANWWMGRDGRFGLGRKPVAKRMRRTLKAIKAELRRRMHDKPVKTGQWLGRVLRGWLGYYAVPTSYRSLQRFANDLRRLWLHALRQRSQRDRFTWERRCTGTRAVRRVVARRHAKRRVAGYAGGAIEHRKGQFGVPRLLVWSKATPVTAPQGEPSPGSAVSKNSRTHARPTPGPGREATVADDGRSAAV